MRSTLFKVVLKNWSLSVRTHPMETHDSDLYPKVNVQRRKRLLNIDRAITFIEGLRELLFIAYKLTNVAHLFVNNDVKIANNILCVDRIS